MYSTVGVHPTRCSEFTEENQDKMMEDLIAVGKEGKAQKKIVAVGELGLDYDRLFFCNKEAQQKYFRFQFKLIRALDLPLFLHERSCMDDFLEILKEEDPEHHLRGCVHSFTGTIDEAKRILDAGFYIGFNGAGMRTEESLEVIKSVPLEKMLLDTGFCLLFVLTADGPYCGISSTHAGYKYVKTHFPVKKLEKYDPDCLVKGRNEPCCLMLGWE